MQCTTKMVSQEKNKNINTMEPFITHLIITQILLQHGHVVAPNFLYHGILHRNYRKMKMNGHFPIISL